VKYGRVEGGYKFKKNGDGDTWIQVFLKPGVLFILGK